MMDWPEAVRSWRNYAEEMHPWPECVKYADAAIAALKEMVINIAAGYEKERDA